MLLFMPTKENYTEMTSSEFEQYALSLLEVAIKDLPNAEVKHNQLMITSDGKYQIDGTIRFETMGVKYLTLVECKMYKNPVSREKVQVLYDKLRAIGAQKGILVTTSCFQKGAIEYASFHGIALVQVVDGRLMYEVRCREPIVVNLPDDVPKFAGIAQYRINENSIGCSNVIKTKYLSEFMRG
jgi:restriction system protein